MQTEEEMDISLKNFNVHTEEKVRYIIFDNSSKSYNVFDTQTLDELEILIDDLESNDYTIVVFSSAKEGFIVGADIKEFGDSLHNVEDLVFRGQSLFNRIEDLPIPSLAIIHQTAMGGGLELALACTSRVCLEDAQLALPEVKLGLLPGWGGTTRLPRLIGIAPALDVICSGRTITSYEALHMGIVDRIINDGEAIIFSELFSSIDTKREQKKSAININSLKAMAILKLAKSGVAKKSGENYPAPLKVIEVIKQCRKMTRDDALQYERAAFVELAKGSVAKNLTSIFLGERKLKSKALGLSKHNWSPLKVAVIGAGAMGSGIAFAIANKTGGGVSLYDPYEEQLNKSNVSNRAYLQNKVEKRYISADECDRIMGRITTTTDIEKAVNQADIVIEAVPENLKLKTEIFQKVYSIAPEAILATNTSTFRVDSLKENLSPDRVAGLHFFNPVSKMPLVEVVRGTDTSDDTISKLCSLALAMKKTPLVCNDCAGFVVNRILMPYLVKFDSMISHGMDFEYVDKVMKDFGWPMGPAELCDLVGIDVIYHGSQNICNEYKYISLPDDSVITNLYNNGMLGQKTHGGFYVWKNQKKGKATQSGNVRPHKNEVIASLMGVMKTEAKRILEENIVEYPHEINMALVFGLGYPPYKDGII